MPLELQFAVKVVVFAPVVGVTETEQVGAAATVKLVLQLLTPVFKVAVYEPTACLKLVDPEQGILPCETPFKAHVHALPLEFQLVVKVVFTPPTAGETESAHVTGG